MEKKSLVFAGLIALVVSLVAVSFHKEGASTQSSSFSHIQTTRTLRCAYAPLSPFIIVDPASGEVQGLYHDVMDEIGKRLGIKIEWTEEVGYGQIAAGFATGRYDSFCGALWATPARASAMNFSAPLYINKVNPCVSAKTTAYNKSVEALNSPDKTFIAYDGDVSMQVARTVFPKAKIMALPENMPFGEAMQNITTGKADALATCDQIVVDDLNKANSGGLKLAGAGKPITYVKVALALPSGDQALKNMIDVVIFDIQADGTLKRIMTKYLGADRVADTTIIPAP